MDIAETKLHTMNKSVNKRDWELFSLYPQSLQQKKKKIVFMRAQHYPVITGTCYAKNMVVLYYSMDSKLPAERSRTSYQHFVSAYLLQANLRQQAKSNVISM
jgi:hypothetical protein